MCSTNDEPRVPRSKEGERTRCASCSCHAT